MSSGKRRWNLGKVLNWQKTLLLSNLNISRAFSIFFGLKMFGECHSLKASDRRKVVVASSRRSFFVSCVHWSDVGNRLEV